MRWDWYKIRNRLFRRYDLIRTGLAKTEWWDTDSKMLYGMMSLVVDLIEKEKWLEHIDFEGSGPEWKHAKEEALEIYGWWKNYPNRQKEIEEALSDWHDNRFKDVPDPTKDRDAWINKINEPETPEDTKRREYLHGLENKLEEEEGEMLIRLVKVRKYLWT